MTHSLCKSASRSSPSELCIDEKILQLSSLNEVRESEWDPVKLTILSNDASLLGSLGLHTIDQQNCLIHHMEDEGNMR